MDALVSPTVTYQNAKVPEVLESSKLAIFLKTFFHIEKPPSDRQPTLQKNIHTTTGKQLIGWWRGFPKTIGLSELRMRLADTTHVTISVSEISSSIRVS